MFHFVPRVEYLTALFKNFDYFVIGEHNSVKLFITRCLEATSNMSSSNCVNGNGSSAVATSHVDEAYCASNGVAALKRLRKENPQQEHLLDGRTFKGNLHQSFVLPLWNLRMNYTFHISGDV